MAVLRITRSLRECHRDPYIAVNLNRLLHFGMTEFHRSPDGDDVGVPGEGQVPASDNFVQCRDPALLYQLRWTYYIGQSSQGARSVQGPSAVGPYW